LFIHGWWALFSRGITQAAWLFFTDREFDFLHSYRPVR
jgi:hypothetical protein